MLYIVFNFLDNNFGEIEMCLNEKLTFNIKIKSRNCELFVLKKNDFLRLSVNFKEFIENFLHKSLMIYLKFNEEKKKIMKEEEQRINRNNQDKANKNDPKQDLEIVDEEKEDADMSDYDMYESEEKTESDSDKLKRGSAGQEDRNSLNNSQERKSEYKPTEQKKSSLTPLLPLDPKDILQGAIGEASKNLNKKNTIRSLKQTVAGEEENQLKYFSDQEEDKGTKMLNNNNNSMNSDNEEPLDKMKNQINKKFIKKIDKILQYLESNNINFNNMENNPRILLKQLKSEANIMEKNNIIDKIEAILKEFYKEQGASNKE